MIDFGCHLRNELEINSGHTTIGPTLTETNANLLGAGLEVSFTRLVSTCQNNRLVSRKISVYSFQIILSLAHRPALATVLFRPKYHTHTFSYSL